MVKVAWDDVQEGVMLDEEFICGECITNMKKIGEDKYQCPKCGFTYLN